MKKWLALFILAFVISYFALRSSNAPVPPPAGEIASAGATTTPTSTPPSSTSSQNRTDKPTVKLAATSEMTASHATLPTVDGINPRYAQKPTEPVVEFTVQEGMAVIYGDIIVGKLREGFTGKGGNIEVDRPRFWTRGEIPFHIDPDVVRPERIRAAIQLFHSRTGVRFVPYQDQADAIVFTPGKEHCNSLLGRVGGLQPIFLSEDCSSQNIAHEIMHALGFAHEQSRVDRDQHVSIFWSNIQPQYQSQYAILPLELMEVFGDSAFDPSSIIMYGPHDFAVDPKAETMKMKNGAEIKPSPQGLSDLDVERLNRLYRQ